MCCAVGARPALLLACSCTALLAGASALLVSSLQSASGTCGSQDLALRKSDPTKKLAPQKLTNRSETQDSQGWSLGLHLGVGTGSCVPGVSVTCAASFSAPEVRGQRQHSDSFYGADADAQGFSFPLCPMGFT